MRKAKDVSRLVRRARKSIGLSSGSQQALLRKVRDTLELTNEELAAALEISGPTLMAWLAPVTAAKHRGMPDTARLVLQAMLAQEKNN